MGQYKIITICLTFHASIKCSHY